MVRTSTVTAMPTSATAISSSTRSTRRNAGWWIGDDVSNAPGATNDFFDYELVVDPNLDPNDPNAFFFVLSAWWWFGGTPFAQGYLIMWATGEPGCPAECSTSLDDDCDVDFDDLNVLLSVYGGNPGHPADFGPPAGRRLRRPESAAFAVRQQLRRAVSECGAPGRKSANLDAWEDGS